MARIELPPSAPGAAGDEPEVVRALSLRPDLAHAVTTYDQAVWNSNLDWRLHELVRMRVAQINQCTVCLGWRTPQAVEAGVTEELLDGVDKASTDRRYTPAERVAIEYATRYCTDSAAIEDDLIDRLRQHFDSGQIVELTLVIAKYLAFGRFMQVLGLDQTCSLQFDESGAVVPSRGN